MEVIKTYIVRVKGVLRVVYSTATAYFITTDEAPFIKQIPDETAWKIIEGGR